MSSADGFAQSAGRDEDPRRHPLPPGDEFGASIRSVVRILARCLRLLTPLRQHLLLLCAGFAGLTLLLVPPSLLFLDLIWTRALQGEPLPPLQAWLLQLDPATSVQVEALSAELRGRIARRTIVAAVGLVAVVAPLGMGLWYYQVWILQRLNQLLRMELLERFQNLSLRFHSEARVGDAIYRLTQDSAMVTSLVEVLLLTPAYTIGGYLLSLVLISTVDPRMALLLLAAWGPPLAASLVFSTPMRIGFRAARAANAALTARIQEGVAGMRALKAYGAEAREQAIFEQASRDAFDAAFDARQRFALYAVLVFAGVSTVLAAAAAWGALETAREAEVFAVRLFAVTGVGAWNLGLFQWFRGRFGDGTNQLRRLFRTWGRAQDISIGLTRVFEILDLEPEVIDAPDAIAVHDVRRGLEFRGVDFQYREDRPALTAIDLEVPVGGITAVVGPTGAGKSTLLALALRLFDPDRGAIELDGIDLRRVRVADLRRVVAIALQENLLFGTTIRENIRYAVPDASDGAVRAAARIACADEFIESLPLGYDTPLGERGSKLSTGQRQRLSLARAVLKNAPILLLDEPTASLDAETEARVLGRLAAWGRDRAILMVTHRLSTVRHAQRIAVLHHGQLVESGTHDELMALGDGAYWRLIRADASEGPES
jgi:ABC-type multidrug transport system fused ATPase/permease subunit